MVRALRAGLPVTEAIINAGQEIGDPVGTELRGIEAGMRVGRDLDSLLWDIAKRITAPEFRFFIIALSVQRETGGNLAETLNNLSEVLRRRRAMRAKARAMASEARASTMILGSLPIFVSVILSITSPAYIAPLFTDVRGLMLVGLALLMLLDRHRDHGQDGAIRDLSAVRRAMGSTRVEDFRLEDWLPYWLSADDLIAGLAALAVLVALVAIWQALRGPDAFDRRFARIATQRHEACARRRSARVRRAREMTAAGLMSEVVTRLNLLRSQHATTARTLLARAGMRSSEAMVRYLFARLAMPFVFGLGVLADGSGPQLLPIPEHLRLFAALGGAVLGFYAPDIFLKNRIQKRAHQIGLGLPDALDLLVICAEAGLSLDAALVRVSRELELTWPELSEEFAITAAELTYLPGSQALRSRT